MNGENKYNFIISFFRTTKPCQITQNQSQELVILFSSLYVYYFLRKLLGTIQNKKHTSCISTVSEVVFV